MTQDDLYALLPFVLLALVFWFLVFRPARKRQRETMQTQASLEVGAPVMLTSGILGTVTDVRDQAVDVELAPGTVVSAHRQAIGKVLSADDPLLAPDEPADAITADPAVADDADDIDADAASASADLPPTHQEKK